MNAVEKDRLVEILFYLYFKQIDKHIKGKPQFWKMINSICETYDINAIHVSRAVRILIAKENMPSDEETYYLLNKAGLSVRPINKISGIYWQKQVKFTEEFAEGKTPVIERKILDIIVKRAIHEFIYSIYSLNGIFNNVDLKTINKII